MFTLKCEFKWGQRPVKDVPDGDALYMCLDKAEDCQSGEGGEGVGVADFVFGDHTAEFGKRESAALLDGLVFVMAGSGGAGDDASGEEEIGMLIGKAGGGEEAAHGDQFAIGSEFVSGLLAKLAEGGGADGIGILMGGIVDLTGREFPKRCADGDALLADKEEATIGGHGGDDGGGFAMHYGPMGAIGTGGGADAGEEDLKVVVGVLEFVVNGVPAGAVLNEGLEGCRLGHGWGLNHGWRLKRDGIMNRREQR